MGNQRGELYKPRNETSKKTILILPASAESIMNSRWRAENTKIRGAIERADKNAERVDLQERPYINTSDLSEELTKLKPHIIHISGIADGVERLVLGDSNQSNQNKLIAELFELYSQVVHCVILSGCYAEEQAREIAQHIEFVIGISESVEEVHAISFLKEFYFQLASEQTIRDSYKFGYRLPRNDGCDPTKLPKLFIKSDEVKHRDLEKELNSCVQEIERSPNNLILLKKEASLLKDLGRIEEAAKALERASVLKPKDYKIRVAQGDALKQLGDNEKAIVAYDKAIEVEEKDYRVWWKKAKAHAEAKEYVKAVESYREALSLNSDSPDSEMICREYSFILGKLNRYPEGVLLYKTSLSLQPKYRVANYEKKQMYQKIYSRRGDVLTTGQHGIVRLEHL